MGQLHNFSCIRLYYFDENGDEKYCKVFLAQLESSTPINPHYVISYNEIKDNFCEILKKWYNLDSGIKYKHLRKSLFSSFIENSYVETFRNMEYLVTESKLINTQAIENQILIPVLDKNG
ncbi:hypothetical protein [Methanimicrococcus hacksteinii]|uniref:hypothetical protein n=1 Tax=Methanimicrococcus hacksteinii TaxID=3028293 RepID=UPI00298EFE86|nr:hypothetical protein [Methanimicrococcus sp. At1]